MQSEGRLAIEAGVATNIGPRAENQDYAGVWLGDEDERLHHGVLAALADGVGGGKGGRMAAELAVHSVIDGYYSLSDTIGPAAAVAKVMAAYNRWLSAMGQVESMAMAASTFTCAVLKGRKAHILHVGDSRAWHWRDGNLVQITQDHTHPQPGRTHVLYRALGGELLLRLDHDEVMLAEGDRLLLTCDGVHGVLSLHKLETLLGQGLPAQAQAEAIIAAALAAETSDNSTCVVLDITSLPADDHDTIAGDLGRLPILPPPAEGDKVDRFHLDRQLSDGRFTSLFHATDTATGERVVIKFPKPELLSEKGAMLAFAREILVGSRVNSPFVGSAILVSPEEQTRLYGVQPFYAGKTLEQRINDHIHYPLSLGEQIDIAVMLTKAIAALHRQGIVHRDIKPDNVIIEVDGGLKLIDLGVVRLPKLEDFAPDEVPGTPSFLAPEMYEGNKGDEATDQYALGVTLWRMFAGVYPYGEVAQYDIPAFKKPALPSTHNPDIPGWLDAVLMRAVAVRPKDRYANVLELLRALNAGPPVKRALVRPQVKVQPLPMWFWQAAAVLELVALIWVMMRK